MSRSAKQLSRKIREAFRQARLNEPRDEETKSPTRFRSHESHVRWLARKFGVRERVVRRALER